MENKLDPSKTYRTRSGLEVRDVRRNETGNRLAYPWCAEVLEDGYWRWKSFKDDGSFFSTGHQYDLIEVPKTMEQPMALDFTKPETLQLRGGGEFRIYATDCGGEYPIHGAILIDGSWKLTKWSVDGRRISVTTDCIYDLIRKPLRVTGWVNVYPGGILSKLGQDREEASKHRGSSCIGQIYIDAEVQS